MEKFLILTANDIPAAPWTMKNSTRRIKVGQTKWINGLKYTLIKAYPYLVSLAPSGGYTNRFKFIAYDNNKQVTKWAYYCDIDGAFRFTVDQKVEIVKETTELPDWFARSREKINF